MVPWELTHFPTRSLALQPSRSRRSCCGVPSVPRYPEQQRSDCRDWLGNVHRAKRGHVRSLFLKPKDDGFNAAPTLSPFGGVDATVRFVYIVHARMRSHLLKTEHSGIQRSSSSSEKIFGWVEAACIDISCPYICDSIFLKAGHGGFNAASATRYFAGLKLVTAVISSTCPICRF